MATKPKKRPPSAAGARRSKAARRAEIVAAARSVFARLGYHQSTIDDIVAEAGVARGTFYLYFEDKRAVLAEVVDRLSSRLGMAIQRIVTDDPARSVDDQVHQNIRDVVGVCLSDRAATRILFTDPAGIDPGFDRKLFTFYDEAVQLLTESLRDGQALGIVRDGEPRVLAYLTIGALKELLYQAVTLGLAEESAEVLAAQMHAFLRDGYLVPPPRRRRRPGAS